ncbi:unnamed protein product, partial [Ectocarpus fasciculatus]
GSAANGKKRATKKPRGPSAKKGSPASSKGKAAGGAKGKARRRASDNQIANQLKVVKQIKARTPRLKEVVGRFEEAYP